MVLFVYGSLMAEEVLKILIGRVPKMQPAMLANYARHPVAGACFPAIVANKRASVEGRLLEDLSPPDLAVLDFFEDEEYVRTAVNVVAGGETKPCTAYVWPIERADLLKLDAEWSYDAFRSKDLESYLVMTAEVRAEFERSQTRSLH